MCYGREYEHFDKELWVKYSAIFVLLYRTTLAQMHSAHRLQLYHLCVEETCFVVQFFMGLLARADKLATTTKQPNKALRNIPCHGKHLNSMVSFHGFQLPHNFSRNSWSRNMFDNSNIFSVTLVHIRADQWTGWHKSQRKSQWTDKVILIGISWWDRISRAWSIIGLQRRCHGTPQSWPSRPHSGQPEGWF